VASVFVLKPANPSLRQHGFCQCLWLSQGVALILVNVFNRAWVVRLFVAICRFIRVIGAKRRLLSGSR
jgi:hypothetical protein